MSRKGALASRSLEYCAPSTPNFLKALQAQVDASQRYSSHRRRPQDELDSLVSSAAPASASGAAAKRRRLDEQDDEDEDEEEGGGWLDSGDEMHGAQVVVLKQGKHLSHDEAVRLKKQADLQSSQPKDGRAAVGAGGKTQSIADVGAGGAAGKKRRRCLAVAADDPDPAHHKRYNDALPPPGLDNSSAHPNTDPLQAVNHLIRQSRSSPPSTTTHQPSPSSKDNPHPRLNHQPDKLPRSTPAAQPNKPHTKQQRRLKGQPGKGLSFDLDDI